MGIKVPWEEGTSPGNIQGILVFFSKIGEFLAKFREPGHMQLILLKGNNERRSNFQINNHQNRALTLSIQEGY